MNVVCATDVCPIVLSSKCVFYEGGNLPFTGIVTNDNLQSALQKIELAFEGGSIGYVFQNGLTNIGSNTIELGGSILHNTTILGNYRLQFQGSLGASLFDSGGTSSQFVKGDGTLDSTTYQPSGNYITSLTGDATASGPGNASVTLSTVNSNPGTFGDNSHIPVITVNNKGLLTNVSTVAVSIPSGSLSFVGDVTGSGTTGSPVTLTLATVNTNIYNTDSFLKFSVNGKGLITSASPITALDIDGVLGYTPYDASNPAGYITLSSLSATSPITYASGNFSTSMSTNRLIGRSTAGTGVMEEIQLGTGLTLSGGVLNSTGGTVTSVGLSMPSAFNVASSPITTSGTISVTGAGLASQYIRGDGTLGDFPSVAGGASINYYLNGSVASGVVGYEQMSRVAVIGVGTNFSIATNGYIASFLTDVGDPNQLSIPGGNWIIRCYFQASSTGGSPSFYVELYKYDGSFTLLASSVANPEVITGGTAVDLYTTALAVPTTTLLATDRLAIRIWVNNAGRTITLHTEDTNLDEINTTFSTGISSLNSLTSPTQYFATSTTGTDFTISSATDTHTFNLPIASGTNTGKLSNTDWTTFNNKVTSVSGTTNRITSTGGTTPVIDISASYVGQTSITTLGTVTTGTFSTGTIIGGVTMTLGSDASYDTYYRNSSGVLTRLPNGTTGQIYIATTGSAPSWSTLSSLAVTSISGTVNQITASASTGAVTLSLPSLVAFPGTWTIGTLSYSDTGILWSAQSSINSYNQSILQNTNAGATASTNFIVSNDSGTATTNYGELGINSSGFTGSGSFNIAGAVYLDASSGDLVLGTLANKPIHFVVNNGSTDAFRIETTGALTASSYLNLASISNPPQPTSSISLFSNSGNHLSWMTPQDAFSRTITAGTLTANRTYTLRDYSGSFLIDNGNNTLNGATTITHNTANFLTFASTFTATANNQYSRQYTSTLTTRTTSSDAMIDNNFVTSFNIQAPSGDVVGANFDFTPSTSGSGTIGTNASAIRLINRLSTFISGSSVIPKFIDFQGVGGEIGSIGFSYGGGSQPSMSFYADDASLWLSGSRTSILANKPLSITGGITQSGGAVNTFGVNVTSSFVAGSVATGISASTSAFYHAGNKSFAAINTSTTIYSYVSKVTIDNGVINTLGAITAGSGYTPGTYNNQALTGGSGTSATANIIINGSGNVSSVTISAHGKNYKNTDVLSASLPGGTGFSIPVSTVDYSGVQAVGYAYSPSQTDNTSSTLYTGYYSAPSFTLGSQFMGTVAGIWSAPTITNSSSTPTYSFVHTKSGDLGGIGTSSPAATWDIRGSGSTNPAVRIASGGTSTEYAFRVQQSDVTTDIFWIKGNGDTQIGLSSSKLGFFGTSAISKITTGVAGATFVANSGTGVNDTSTFGGYTIKQIVQALQNYGLLT